MKAPIDEKLKKAKFKLNKVNKDYHKVLLYLL